MPTGTLKKFFAEKGFGFIAPDDGSPDLFAPERLLTGDKSAIREGGKVTFESELEERTNKPKASRWSMLDPGQAAALAAASMSFGAVPGYGTLPVGSYGAVPSLDAARFSPYGALTAVGMPSMPGFPSALPPGWEQVLDPASGKPYYCNRVTGESSWTPPVAPMAVPMVAPMPVPAPAPTLPAGWDMTTDPASGKPYYYNRATGVTQWTPPEA
mmetsp:Transcript_23989/g.38142  ORF Transcript_23989/g.38142 Transcript_23989/m.38142 type:complete len:213 (+) Transcript_23989:34-672(+)